MTCEVCGSSDLVEVLDLGNHPMCDDLIPVNIDKSCKEFPINILFCNNCHTALQKHSVPKYELFPSSYHYRARFTKDVLDGMADLIQSVDKFSSLTDKKFLDIGCNDVILLNLCKISRC